MQATQAVTNWLIRPIAGFNAGKPMGFDVYRIHSPYTDKAKIEYLHQGKTYRTESDAQAAINAIC